jgi:uncharacterized protein (DUF1330 family)
MSMTDSNAMITLCVLLWAHDGKADDLARYEDTVLKLIVEHGGTVPSRVRLVTSDEGPDEIHVIQFPHQTAFDNYMADPRRQELGARNGTEQLDAHSCLTQNWFDSDLSVAASR